MDKDMIGAAGSVKDLATCKTVCSANPTCRFLGWEGTPNPAKPWCILYRNCTARSPPSGSDKPYTVYEQTSRTNSSSAGSCRLPTGVPYKTGYMADPPANESCGTFPYGPQSDELYSYARGAAGVDIQMFNASQLPIKASVAKHFGVFNKFYTAVPSGSMPNHMFLQSAVHKDPCSCCEFLQ